MKSLIFALALSLSTTMASAHMIVESLPAFPLKGPSQDRPAAEHAAHDYFVCLTDALKSMTSTRTQNGLQGVNITIAKSTCAPQGLELTFQAVKHVNGLYVLNLVSPAIETTPLAAYRQPSLHLSLVDFSQAPVVTTANQDSLPLMKFRLIFNHAENYDSVTYGQFTKEYQTVDHWMRTLIEVTSTKSETLPAGCNPRIPKAVCFYSETTFNAIYENTLTGVSQEISVTEKSLLP